ncbi:MAG: hypothetical protein K9H84_08620 [Bacteroidales bacterium]|nr:hypothetical protein [Bacteroidales bacterium]
MRYNNIDAKILLPVLIVFLFYGERIAGQENLILNHSFEEKEDCPESIVYRYEFNRLVKHWSQPTFGSVLLFHSCGSSHLKVPQNMFGYQIPVSGKAYINQHIYSSYRNNNRAYFQCQLKRELQKDCIYYFEAKLSLEESSLHAVNNFGIALNKRKRFNLFTRLLKQKKGLNFQNSYDDGYFASFTEWMMVSGYYRAEGDEAYLIMGNFRDDEKTGVISVESPQQMINGRPLKEVSTYNAASYYIDNVYFFSADSVKKHIHQRMQDSAVNTNFYDRRTQVYEYRWDTVALKPVSKDTSAVLKMDSAHVLAPQVLKQIRNDSVDSVYVVNYYQSEESKFAQLQKSLQYARSIKRWIKLHRPNLYCESYGLAGNQQNNHPPEGKAICKTELLLKKRLGEKKRRDY